MKPKSASRMTIIPYAGRSLTGEPQRDAILRAIPPGGCFLEIGTFCGATARYIADQRPDARVVALDILAVHAADNARNIAVNYKTCVARNLNFFLGSSGELAGLINRPAFHAIMVDGGHHYLEVFRDLEVVRRLLMTPGTVLMHDYGPQARYAEVIRAADEFCVANKLRVASVVDGTTDNGKPSKLAVIPVEQWPDD